MLDLCAKHLICAIMKNITAFFILFLLITTGCVPVKQLKELREKYENCDEQRNFLSGETDRLSSENTELKAEIERLQSQVDNMITDTASTAKKYRELKHEFDRLQTMNEELIQSSEQSKSASEAENKKLMSKLMKMQNDLQEKEDRLKLLEKELNQKEADLSKLQDELIRREARVKELEELITQKDEAVKSLRDKVKNALTGFADKGITVEQRNGRVYVSMEAKLLFSSGSTKVGNEGTTAVIELAKALEETQDITILVEGHTDSDPIKTSSIQDNWDLSVKRATSVVRIMLGNSKIKPGILTAAGRGEFFPVAENDTPEGKAKNRRIEVILTPDLDKLFQILEENAEAISNP